jgi:hypothetical protein
MNTNNDAQKRLDTLKRFGVASGLTAGAALMTSQANAIDVGTALAATTAQADIDTAAVWILGIAVTIFAARKVIGFFSR